MIRNISYLAVLSVTVTRAAGFKSRRPDQITQTLTNSQASDGDVLESIWSPKWAPSPDTFSQLGLINASGPRQKRSRHDHGATLAEPRLLLDGAGIPTCPAPRNICSMPRVVTRGFGRHIDHLADAGRPVVGWLHLIHGLQGPADGSPRSSSAVRQFHRKPYDWHAARRAPFACAAQARWRRFHMRWRTWHQ
jgi:hypothetical protein